MKIRLTQIDGALPNLALMKLAHWHKARGDEVTLLRSVDRDMFEPEYDRVYGSCIFKFSRERLARFEKQFPGAIVGGTGTESEATVEGHLGVPEYEHYDYLGYPDFKQSIGFTSRGCRLKCKFCVVSAKEGKPRSVNTIDDIYRGEPYPKHINLLDNDFFGQEPVKWAKRVQELVTGGFKVCLQQGINVRLLHPAACVALKNLEYRNTKFNERKLYTAWDNIGDERIFFKGVDMLEYYGIPPKHLMAYMLIGFDRAETWDRIWHRFDRMVERGIEPYPMVFDRSRKDLTKFARWVATGLYRAVPFTEYDASMKGSAAENADYAARQGDILQ